MDKRTVQPKTMNFTSLKYFLAVAEEQNITKAAEKLFISQQALSGHITRLEKELGVRLFDRQPSLALTYAGRELKKHAEEAGQKLSNMFKFCEDVFEEGQEMVILVTELTISSYGARFISRYGCKEYFAHNKELLFYERQKEIITELENLEL